MAMAVVKGEKRFHRKCASDISMKYYDGLPLFCEDYVLKMDEPASCSQRSFFLKKTTINVKLKVMFAIRIYFIFSLISAS